MPAIFSISWSFGDGLPTPRSIGSADIERRSGRPGVSRLFPYPLATKPTPIQQKAFDLLGIAPERTQ